MKYITLNDLSSTIRKNLWKIPRDIDFIIAIPRSGTICASIISEFLNVPLIDIDSFVAGVKPYGGGRLRYYYDSGREKTGKVLVVDDTVYNGTSKAKAKEKLSSFTDIQFVYMAVYQEGPVRNAVDFFLEDVSQYTNGFTELVIYEWNIFHHNEDVMLATLYDMDGVLCVDPPDERNEEAYIEYIKNATPLFVPSAPIGGIVTYRLIKNQDITLQWLADHGVKCGKLWMSNAKSWEERNQIGIPPEVIKGQVFKEHPEYRLFIESNAHQAKTIHEISGKPVLCIENNVLYGGA